jgi:hypothetical protein
VGVVPGCLSQGPDDVQPPYGEGPRDRNHLEGVSQEVGLAGVELAPFAGAHDLTGIRDRSGPVEALAECIAYESVQRHMVSAHARVDVPEELAPLGDGHTSLQDA